MIYLPEVGGIIRKYPTHQGESGNNDLLGRGPNDMKARGDARYRLVLIQQLFAQLSFGNDVGSYYTSLKAKYKYIPGKSQARGRNM